MYLEKYVTFSKNLDNIKIAQAEKMSNQLGNARTKNRKKCRIICVLIVILTALITIIMEKIIFDCLNVLTVK